MTDLSVRVRDWLCQDALPLWAGVGFDDGLGLFHEKLTPGGQPDRAANRRVRVQARQIYVYSHARVLGLWSGPDREMTAFETLLRLARRPDGHGFAHLLGPDASVLDARFDAYDHAFVLLAFAWLYRASGAPEVKREMDGVFAAIQTVLAAPDAGGYREDDRGSLPRRQNPHMHLFEAFLAAFEATRDERYLAAAGAMRRLFETRFFRPEEGVLTEFFQPDWTPAEGDAGRIIEPGHHFEWVWLLGAHNRLAGLSETGRGRRLHGFALAHGIDARSGLAVDEVWQDGGMKLATKRCWPQTERIKAEITMAEWSGEPSSTAVDAAVERLFEHYISKEVPGGWRDLYDAENQPISGPMPASSFYHIILALTEYLRHRGALSAGGVRPGK